MNDQYMIDELCAQWAARCERIDDAFSAGKSELGFAIADEFDGWLCGFRDACFAMRLHEAEKTINQALQLFIYRKHYELRKRFSVNRDTLTEPMPDCLRRQAE